MGGRERVVGGRLQCRPNNSNEKCSFYFISDELILIIFCLLKYYIRNKIKYIDTDNN